MTVEREQLQEMLTRHSLFGEFADWLRLHSDTPFRDNTVYSYLRGLDLIARKHGLNLDNPNIEDMLKKINGAGAATQSYRR